MTSPGFNAQASLYSSSGYYTTSLGISASVSNTYGQVRAIPAATKHPYCRAFLRGCFLAGVEWCCDTLDTYCSDRDFVDWLDEGAR